MCTVSWLQGLARLELHTNRDELRTRSAALPPAERRTAQGLRYLAPLDPVGGGTWVAAGEQGLVLCLVNHYQAREPRSAGDVLSRGRVVTELIGSRDPEHALDRAAALPLARLRGFRLLALGLDRPAALFDWDGERAAVVAGDAVELPLVSSSVRFPEVRRTRQALFHELVTERGGPTPELLAGFHASELPEPGPLAVSMSRADASTVSHTRVVVEPGRVSMHYREGRPSQPGSARVVELTHSRSARA